MYAKLKKVKLYPPNLLGEYNLLPGISLNIAIHKLCKVQFLKKLFAVRFPNKNCDLTALPTRQDGVKNHDQAYSVSHIEPLWRI